MDKINFSSSRKSSIWTKSIEMCQGTEIGICPKNYNPEKSSTVKPDRVNSLKKRVEQEWLRSRQAKSKKLTGSFFFAVRY